MNIWDFCKRVKFGQSKTHTLATATCIGDQHMAAGSRFRAFETADWGWIVFDRDALAINGNKPSHYIHKR